MPKECGSWRAFRAQACHPPPGPAHPLHYQLTQSLPSGRLLSPRPHSCCVELAHRAHTGTGLNRPMRPERSRRCQHQVTLASRPSLKAEDEQDVTSPHLACAKSFSAGYWGADWWREDSRGALPVEVLQRIFALWSPCFLKCISKKKKHFIKTSKKGTCAVSIFQICSI